MQIQRPIFELFLMKFRSLPIGNLGTVVLEREAAFHDYTSKVIQPAKDKLSFLPSARPELISELEQFAQGYGVSTIEIRAMFGQIEQQLNDSQQALIQGIGVLKIENNSYVIVEDDIVPKYFSPIQAGAVIHEGAVHEVKVGENVRTSDEMKAMLASKPSKDYWWVYALLLVLVAIAALLYYLYGDQFFKV